MFTAIVLIPPLTYFYTKFNLVDIPSPRKVHSIPVPRVGGIAIVIATILPVVWWIKIEIPIIGMLLGVAVLFVLGVIDDAKNLSYKSKFLVQFIAITLIFISGFIDVNSSHYVVNELLPKIFLFVAYFIFILGVTNAINLSDGLDGLAGGEALLSFSIIGLLAYEINNITIVLLILAIIGSVFGFLRFNTYPAKIFMGDTGSLFLGFILGVLSVALTYSADNAYSKALPLLLVGLPIFDTLMVMCIRLFNGLSPFNADRNHLHHKLLDHGFKHYQSVLIIYAIQSVYILTAYFMRYDTELNIILAFCIISSFVFFIGIAHKRVSSETDVKNNIVYSKLMLLRRSIANKQDIILTLLALLIIIYIFTAVVNIYSADVNILFLLIIICILPIIGMIFYSKKPCNWLERIAIHVMIVLSIYFGTQNIDNSQINTFHLAVLGACILLIAILFVGGGEKKFVGSPLDFLLVATAIVIPNLPRSPVSDPALSILVIKLIILFYCIEYILFNIKTNWWVVRTTLMLSACVPVFINFL